MRIRCRDYRTGGIHEVESVGDRITAIHNVENAADDSEVPWIAPGLFDLQINGAGGVSFNSADLTMEQVGQAVRMIACHGATGMLPTLVTNEMSALEHAFRTLATARNQDEFVRRRVPGFHLEGPWISAEDGYRGAHPKQFVRLPNWDDFRRLQDAAGGLIKMVTLAPELPGAIDLIEQLHESDVRVGLGHTAANDKTIEAAWYAGATISTHLGNGLPEMVHRHHNPMWAHLAWGWLTASVIMDGQHIPDAVFRTIFSAKSEYNVVLISDASSLAGLPAGRYRQWDADVELTPEGRLQVVGTPYLAGSACFLDQCVAKTAAALRSDFGLPIAWDLASTRPRELLGLPKPTMTVDSPAGLVVFDYEKGGSLQIRHVLNGS